MFDAIVVGAGPAGSTAAYHMAMSGLKVLLLDRSKFPRDKVCGDAISGKCLPLLREMGLTSFSEAPSAQYSWGITFGSPSGDQANIPFYSGPRPDNPTCVVCTREEFDNELLQKAREAGASVVEGATAHSLLWDGTQVVGIRAQVVGEDGAKSEVDYAAPLVVGADGVQSVVARELGMKLLDERHFGTGLRAYYQGVTGFNDGHYIEIHFVEESLPGYFWIFPLGNGRANVGVGMPTHLLKKSRYQLKKVLNEVIESPRFRDRFAHAELQGPVLGCGLPLGSKPRTMAGNGWMLIGDAASLIDPFTGEGIGNAMVSAVLAAQVATEAHRVNDFSHTVLSKFELAVQNHLSKELKLSHAMQSLVRWKWLLNAVIRKASRSQEVSNVITHMFASVDQRKKLVSPLFYVRLLFA